MLVLLRLAAVQEDAAALELGGMDSKRAGASLWADSMPCQIRPCKFDLGSPAQLRGKAPVKHSQLREKDLVAAVVELLKGKQNAYLECHRKKHRSLIIWCAPCTEGERWPQLSQSDGVNV